MARQKINNEGWTSLQEADASKHILEVNVRSENGKVCEVRVRHHDGEEQLVKVFYNGAPALPMDNAEFSKLVDKYELDFK